MTADVPSSQNLERQCSSFWASFLANESKYEAGISPDSRELSDLSKKLHEIDPQLYFELGFNNLERRIAISAGGRENLFALADRIVAQAPKIKGWEFVSLLPARGFDTLTVAVGAAFPASELWFMPLRKKADPKFVGLRIMVPDGVKCDQRTRDAIFLIIDTGLGERYSAEWIKYLELTPFEATRHNLGYRPINELADYLRSIQQGVALSSPT